MTQEKTSRKFILDTTAGPLDFILNSPTLPPAQLGLARPGSAWLGLARPDSAWLGPASASLGLGLLLACTRVEVACLLGLASASTRPRLGLASACPISRACELGIYCFALIIEIYLSIYQSSKTPGREVTSLGHLGYLIRIPSNYDDDDDDLPTILAYYLYGEYLITKQKKKKDDPGGFWPNGKGCAMCDYDYNVNRGG